MALFLFSLRRPIKVPFASPISDMVDVKLAAEIAGVCGQCCFDSLIRITSSDLCGCGVNLQSKRDVGGAQLSRSFAIILLQGPIARPGLCSSLYLRLPAPVIAERGRRVS